MKEKLPAHHYPQRARNLGPRQLPREAEKPHEPRPAPAATIGNPKAAVPATEPRGKPREAR